MTGAARGIGRGIAEVLATRGDHVLVADLDAEAARRTAQELEDAGGHATALGLDVSDVEAVRELVAGVDARTPLDHVVNNAGVASSGSLLEVEPAVYDRTMDVNVRGTFFVLQAALRALVTRRAGSVVNVCSTSSFTASTSDMVVYDTSKAAVRMMTQAAAREVASTGVRVNGVAPGTLATDLTRPLLDEEGLDALARERIPLGRLGQPREIGDAVAFLTSEAATYVTGHVLVVDGGWLA